MKHFILTLVLAFACLVQVCAQTQETLTNQSIVQMMQLGFDGSIIISKINTSANDFDVTTSALMSLKKDSVPNDVIAAMMTAANDPSKKVVDMNDFHTPHEPGIYYYNSNGDLVELLSTMTTGTKTRNALGYAFSYGAAKMKLVSKVPGAKARLEFNQVPKFYFYFSKNGEATSVRSAYKYDFLVSTSPNEFVLAHMDEQKNARELQTWSGNDYTEDSGIDEGKAVHFEVSQIDPGIFEVNVATPPPGQYCFLYSGSTPSGQTKVYDFGIQ